MIEEESKRGETTYSLRPMFSVTGESRWIDGIYRRM